MYVYIYICVYKFAGPTAQRRDRSCLFFRPCLLPPFIPPGTLGPRPRLHRRRVVVCQGFPEPREGPQGTPKKIDRAIFAALGLRFGPRHRSRDLLGGRLGRRTHSWDPLGTFLKPLEAKNEIVNISLVLPSKFEPWCTLADPGPPKKAPHGPDRFFGGPPRRLQGRSPENTKAPGRPLGRQILVSEPSLANPRNYEDENYKKTLFFQKSLECLFL